jgi:hypothetical protein
VQMAKSFWNSLLFITTCFTVSAFALAYGFARGIMSPRALDEVYLRAMKNPTMARATRRVAGRRTFDAY